MSGKINFIKSHKQNFWLVKHWERGFVKKKRGVVAEIAGFAISGVCTQAVLGIVMIKYVKYTTTWIPGHSEIERNGRADLERCTYVYEPI